MSSKEGRLHDSERHLFVIAITIESDSCEEVAITTGFTILPLLS